MTKRPELTFIKPALAEATTEPPKSGPWVHEIKYDGYSIQVHKLNSKVALFTRNGLDWTNRIGTVAQELQSLGAQSAIIDCEAVVLNESGIADFGALQKELKRGAKARITLIALDLLHLDGQDLRKQPLTARKAQLKAQLGQRSKQSLLQFSEHLEGDGTEIFKSACKLGLEGIVSKRLDKPYQSGRSTSWLKAKCAFADPFVVIGFTELKGKPGAVGSLALGYYDNKTLIYAGRVGTGFSEAEAEHIWKLAQSISAPGPKLAKALTYDQLSGLYWMKRKLVAQVEYRSWSSDGLLRHSVFKSFRRDKRAAEIGRPSSLVQSADG